MKYISLSLEMILVICISFFMGYKLDSIYSFKAFFIIVLPIVALFFIIYRLIKELK